MKRTDFALLNRFSKNENELQGEPERLNAAGSPADVFSEMRVRRVSARPRRKREI